MCTVFIFQIHLKSPKEVLSLLFVVVPSLSLVWLFCDPMDCSPSGSSVHRISQARILVWVAISFSRIFSWPRDGTQVSRTDRQILYRWVVRETKAMRNSFKFTIFVNCEKRCYMLIPSYYHLINGNKGTITIISGRDPTIFEDRS